jgi:hypothetical protein
MSLLTGLIGWILFSAVVGVGANTRGRPGFNWFLLSLVISPLLAGLFLIASPRIVKQKDPFADIATLAMIEATPEGSRSRQLLAEHEAKHAAKIEAQSRDETIRAAYARARVDAERRAYRPWLDYALCAAGTTFIVLIIVTMVSH